MDFRQFTFLVRQPSAALRAREHFWGLPKRGVALILANALFWQPLLVRADGIVVSGPGTSLGTAGNGVPIINIAAPNGSGLSHNQFNDYNVGANGVILNNGINRTQETQLGGIILGNPNLKGNAANIILNEVNGGSPSQLRGYTEVAGQSAHVIVANPYGISCNGCGFINTPNVTLTTGKPILDNGRLDRYQVDGGTVSIDGQNLNVSNVDRFEIITRSARINAQINARELTVIAGRNTVDAKTLATTARADDGSAKPELAIDSSALGGMYAGAIKLVGTEAGVGVKLYGPLAASGGDIHIDANGQLILAQAAASGAIAVNAASLDAQAAVYAGTTLEVQTRGELTNRQTLAAKDSITLSSAGRLTNLGIIEAGVITRDSRNTTGDVHLTAQTLDNNGAGVIASRTLTANTQTLNNQGGTLSARQAATVRSGTLDNQNQGRVLSGGSLDLHAAQLLNTAGLVTSNGVLTATASTLDNSGGTLTGAGDVRLNVDGLLSNQRKGLINAGAGLTVNSATLNNQNGSLQGSAIALDFGAATGDLNNTGGLVKTAGPLTLKHLRDLNNQGGEISSEQNLSLSGRTLDNSGGTLISNNLLQLRANTMLNQGGLISGWQGLDVSGASLDNRNNGTLSSRYGNLDVRLSASLLNSGAGALVSQKTLTVRAGELDNSAEGVLSSAGAHSLTVDGLLNNTQGGVIDSGTSLDLSATQLDNSTGNITGGGATTLDLLATLTNTHGKLASGGPLLIQRVVQVNNQGGELTSQGVLTLLTTGLDNRNRGSIAANGSLNITASGFVQNSADGLIYSKNADLQLTANQLDNAKGTLQSQTDLTLGIARNLDNQSGKLLALTRDVSLKAQGLDNRDGGIYAKGQVSAAGNTFDNSGNTGGRVAGEHVSFALTGALNNQNGLVESAGTLTLKTASVDNQAGQLRALGTAGKTTLQTVGLLDNRNGTLESANTDLTLAVGSLQNAGGKVLHGGTGRFDIAPSSLDNVGGRFVTRGAMTINRDNWTNSSAIQAGSLTVDVKTLEQTASGQLLASDSFVGRGSDWSNDGLIASDGNLSLTLDGAYSANGRVSSLGSLDLHAAQVNLSKTASLAGGGDTTLAVAGQFNNAGRVTSAVDLSLVAADVNNTGTLGAGESLTITATTVLNERGLIFSGEDMQLLGASLTNRYAQVYSLGNLLIARDKNGAQADLLDNRSGAIESIGKLTIAATTVNNVMDVLEFTEHEKSAATITRLSCALVPSWGCDDRGGGRINGLWEIAETDRLKVTRQSEAATLISGSNLLINAQALNNISSSISATGNLTVNAETITNQGLQEQEINSIRKYVSFVNETGRAAQMASWFTQRNSPSPSATVEADLSSFLAWTGHYLGQSTSVTQGQSLDAIIQAGGSVDLNAPKTIDNSVIRPYFAFVTAGRTATDTGAGDGYSTPIRVNAQLPPDVAQQQVNPATLPGFNLPTGQNGLFRLSGQGGSDVQAQVPDIDGLAINRVQGLPDSHFASNPHKYLIETNPALTNLKQFMGSDYLLSNLGYNPDQSQKRLGDGLYEQRLIQQAIIARTGQRFLDGQTSDAGMFKYLMDNAIGSKQQLNLAVGVSLTAEQVAALTHDIVWLENTTVNGQQVLVPVLYLAQANNRLAPNGALIAGNDVKLITGKNLNNVGTLRATNSLAASAGRDLNNSGLIEAGSRLNLLAGNNLTNQAGGIIAGRDVSLTAVNGDVLNERSVTRHQASGTGYVQQVRQDFLDTAARIEAANNLALQAGRDVNNVGGVIQSGADLAINAGRDANLLAVEQRQGSVAADNKARSDSTRQYGSIIEAGRDFQLVAGRDISAIASQIDAGRDIDMAAAGDLTLAAAANEQHSSLNTKKVKAQEDHIQQVSTVVNAGRDVSLSAGQDLTLIASRVTAGDEAYLVAGNTLQLLAAEDSDYSLYDMKKKGSFGSKETKRDEVTNVTHVGSEIKTGGDLTLESAGDQRYQAAKLNSGNDITLDSGGAITFEVVKDLRQESHEKSKNNAFWVSSKGKGNTDETVRQTQMVAEGNIAIKAVEGLKIDVKQVNQQTVNQSIDAMVKADPQLTWIKDAEARGDVDWKQVKEIHDSFKYNNSGLGPASQIVIAIVMAAVIGPMAGAMAGGGTTGAVVGAVAAGASTNATVSVVNNRGDLGAVFKDVTSSDALKGYVISGATAGLTAGFFDKLTGTQTNLATGKIIPPNLSTWAGVGQFAANQALQNSTSTLLSKALGQGGNAGDALKGALFNTLAAASFNAVGDYTKGKLTDGYPPKIIIHAMVGGLLSRATGGDFKTGALAAGVSEAVVVHLDSLVLGDDTLLSMSSQIVGVLTAAVQKDADTRSLEKAGWVAKNATQYNYLNHQQLERAAKKIAACADDICIEKTTRAYMELSLQQDVDAIASCKADPAACAALSRTVANTMADLNPIRDISEYGSPNAQKAVQHLINSNFEFQEMLAATAAEPTIDAIVDSLRSKWDLSDAQVRDITSGLKVAVAVGVGASSGKGSKRGGGAKGIPSIVEPKIAQQMGKRGWTTDSLEGVIANPSKTVVTKDTRFDPASGTRLNDPATGYVAKDGSYVVRNDRTGAIVQVSDKNDKNWVAPWD